MVEAGVLVSADNLTPLPDSCDWFEADQSILMARANTRGNVVLPEAQAHQHDGFCLKHSVCLHTKHEMQHTFPQSAKMCSALGLDFLNKSIRPI